jgi:hypothetical protein
MTGSNYDGGDQAGDESLIPEMRAALGALFECGSDISDEQLARFRHDVVRVQQEERSEALSRLGTPRNPATYDFTRWAELRERFYRTRIDRAVLMIAGVLASMVGLLLILWPTTSERISGAILLSGGMVLLGQAAQSGRIGFVGSLQRNQLDDWAASLSATFIRGHHQVHDAEAALARRARERRNRRLMVIDLWTRPRQSHTSHEFGVVQEEVLRYALDVEDGKLMAALACTKPNLDQMEHRLRQQLGIARQQVFYGNPLQLDVIITDDEAILSLPRRGTDRDLAFRFRSPAVVNELWDILQSQLGDRVFIESQPVRDASDIDCVRKRIEAQDPPIDFPVHWDTAY